MKKHLFTLSAIVVLSFNSNAQNDNASPNANTQWKINGNTASSTDFMGTTNDQSLIFKTNNVKRVTFDTQGRSIFDGGGEVIIRPGELHRPIPTNPIAAYMLKVGGSGIFEGELNSRQLFVQEYITYMKSLKGPRIDVDTIRMDSTRGIYGHTKIVGDLLVKQNLSVEGEAIFKNNLKAEKGIMFDAVNGLKYTPPTATSGAKYNLGGGTYQPLSTACPTPHQNYQWFATQGAYISYIGAGTPGASPLVNASLSMMMAPWDGNGLIEVDGTDKNGGTNNGLLINYFCGRNVGICTGENGGTVVMGSKVDMGRSLKIGWTESGNIDLNTSIEVNQNIDNGNGLKVNTWNNSIKALSVNNSNFSTNTFEVYADGRTKIGGVKPAVGYMLSVGGKIMAEEVVVQLQSSWPDYVFSKDYKLTPLTNVAEYISKHHHLQNIPSAKEIETNGVTLGNVVSKQMEKIEELTLYLIEQQKQIEELKKQVESLKK